MAPLVATGCLLLLIGWHDARAETTATPRSQRLLAAEGPKPLALGNTILRIVDAAVPSVLRETVVVPASGALLVGFGLQRDASATAVGGKGMGPDPVEVSITLSSAGEETVVFREQSPARVGAVAWKERFVDLTAYAGKTVELAFAARYVGPPKKQVAGAAGTRVWWQAPMLYTPTRSGDPPNVIVVALDTLRADHLNSYGHTRDTAPAIAAFAARGVVFAQAFSQAPWTLPSMVSIFTGLRPGKHEVVHADRALSADIPTLPDVLQRAGYYTAGFHNGGYLSYAYGFHHSFDLYEQIDGLRSMPRVLQWIRQHQSLPFFVFLHSYDVHAPYGSVPPQYHDRFSQGLAPQDSARSEGDPPEASVSGAARQPAESGLEPAPRFDLLKRKPARIWSSLKRNPFEPADYQRMRDLYDGEIRFVDDRLGELFRALGELKLRRRTLVILLSDHGEEFGEHGKVEHHNGHLYRELVHIPLVMSGPGIARGRRVEQLVEAVDVFPTVLDLLGIDPKGIGPIDGRSLAPLLSGDPSEREDVKRYAVSETHDFKGARVLRSKNWTLLESQRDGQRLFDRRNDPDELTDVQAAHPEVVERFRRRLDELAAQGARTATPARPVDDEETKAQLRALGYIE